MNYKPILEAIPYLSVCENKNCYSSKLGPELAVKLTLSCFQQSLTKNMRANSKENFFNHSSKHVSRDRSVSVVRVLGNCRGKKQKIPIKLDNPDPINKHLFKIKM